MTCQTITVNVANLELDWGGLLLQDGLADDSSSVKLEFTGGDVEIKTSGTGKYSIVYTNNNTMGELTLLMNDGSPMAAKLRALQFSNFGRREDFEIRDLLNGEVFTMSCAGFKNRAGKIWGNNADGTSEFIFNFAAVDGYVAATNLQTVE